MMYAVYKTMPSKFGDTKSLKYPVATPYNEMMHSNIFKELFTHTKKLNSYSHKQLFSSLSNTEVQPEFKPQFSWKLSCV